MSRVKGPGIVRRYTMAFGFGPAVTAEDAEWLERLLADPHRVRRVHGYEASYVVVGTLGLAAYCLSRGMAIWWQVSIAGFLFLMALAWSQTRRNIRRAEWGLEQWRAQAAERRERPEVPW